MPGKHVLGWDIGGAHLKVAAVDHNGKVVRVLCLPCPLWQGLDYLDRAIAIALEQMPAAARHAVTMTGELSDVFRNRAYGVKSIIARLVMHVPAPLTGVYAPDAGFLAPHHAARKSALVASANWAASAELVAGLVPEGLFVDIGSTTTDVVSFREGRLCIRGLNDADRLASEELVYTGVVRTPIMALTRHIPFNGQRISAMAEYFATTADVYRVTGQLPKGADLLAAADRRGKSVRDSARRIARMIGRDLESAPMAQWRRCARNLAELQSMQIQNACENQCWRANLTARAPLIGAGTGRFLAKKLAKRLGMRYRDFNSLINVVPAAASRASDCAPAVAVALLAHRSGK
jgi:(4-(4-[2-(gamma-L-glutamylamino)ethyl]phenoxymethyl)furan-2-yl)methanamine synthase